MKFLILILALTMTGCGYSSRQNDAVGQIKKVVHQTPLICPERTDMDMSLGVMRNGVGSMSSQDLWFTLKDESQAKTLNEAAQTGAIVKLTYSVARLTFCTEDHLVDSVEVLK